MLWCLETTSYTGRIPILYGRNTAQFNDRTIRISAPDLRTVTFNLRSRTFHRQVNPLIPDIICHGHKIEQVKNSNILVQFSLQNYLLHHTLTTSKQKSVPT